MSELLTELNPSRKPLPQRVADELVELIKQGVFQPGDKLPSEYELMQQLGVSRSTVREATKLLVSRHVLEVHRGSGTFVCQRMGVSEDPLGLQFIADRKKTALDLCELRMMIEPQIVALAAQKATGPEIEEMQALCDRVRMLILSGEDHAEPDIKLHVLWATCTRNTVIPNLIPIMMQAIPLFINLTNRSLLLQTIQTHQAIVDAIRARDPEGAAAAMRRHIDYNRLTIEMVPPEEIDRRSLPNPSDE